MNAFDPATLTAPVTNAENAARAAEEASFVPFGLGVNATNYVAPPPAPTAADVQAASGFTSQQILLGSLAAGALGLVVLGLLAANSK